MCPVLHTLLSLHSLRPVMVSTACNCNTFPSACTCQSDPQLCMDMQENREVTKDEGREFAKQHGCLFVETSAKRNIAVQQAFEELVQKILETPSLLDQGPTGGKLPTARPQQQSMSCCS